MTDIKFMKDVRVPMRDGLDLAANIYLPDKPGKFPVIMAFTGFGKDVFWSEQFHGFGMAYEPWSPTMTGTITFEANDPHFWCNYDYAIMLVDPRGFNRSPGTRAKAAIDGSPGEQAVLAEGRWARDEYDAIEWAGVQEWSNGNVALSGVSIFAFSQWRVAGNPPPHLKCINPWEGMTDFYQDCMFPGGIPETKFTTPEDMTTTVTNPQDTKKGGTYIKTCRFEPAWPAPENERPPEIEFMEEDEFLEKIKLPALICGNWNDHGCHTRGSFKAFRKISSEQKWLYTHGRSKWAEFYCSEGRTMRKLFFDHFLKGVDDRILSIPKVQLFVMEDLQNYNIRYEDDYPVKSAVPTRLYLDSASGEAGENPVTGESSVSYVWNEGCAAFNYTFKHDTELLGPSALKLFVSAEDADDMDLFVTLRKFDKNGNEIRFDSTITPRNWTVAIGWMRLSYRKLNTKASTPLEPLQLRVIGVGDKVKPCEIVQCEVAILPTSVLFRKGEHIRIEVSGRYRSGEVIPWQGRCYDDTINRGRHTIYTGGKYDSSILMPLHVM